jgi:iron complex outermembrane recepter protein
VTLFIANPARTQDKTDVTGMSLEELMNIEVTSASKKAETLSQAAAAIFVITADDIRRGGFTSIPEALRMVPGLYVARINADWWSVSARGFSDYLNDKMLILIDGRSLYNPQFGGIDWDQYQIPMDQIERIEVIRGPGGTLWGANAVNGVINIVTKSAAETQGFAVDTSSGAEEGYTTSIRYGGNIGRQLSYRVYGKAEYWYPGLEPSGANAFDTWNMSQGGTRIDWTASKSDTITFDGRGYDGRVHDDSPFIAGPGAPQTTLLERFDVKGGDVLARWRHVFSERSSTDVLGYCQWGDRAHVYEEQRNTCDLEFQHDYQFTPRHSLIWGASVLTTGSYKPPYFKTTYVPAGRRDTTVSGFAQYEVDIIPDRLRVIAGSKFEHNPFTGFEIQPQIRGVWALTKTHTLWGAVSRGVRVPTEFERDDVFQLAQVPGSVPTYLTLFGNPDLKSETLRAYEAGYRLDLSSYLSLDAEVFYNHYENLINVDLLHIGAHGAPIVNSNPLYVEIPVPYQNLGPGQTHGAEIFARVKPISQWNLSLGVTELRGNTVNFGGSLNQPVANTPLHQFNVQSRLDLTRHLAFDSALYYYDGIPSDQGAFVPSQDVPAHNRFDQGFSVHGISGLTFSVWGRDLTTDRHPENLPALFTTQGSYVRRSVVFSLMWDGKPKGSTESAASRPASGSASASPNDR